MPQILSAVALAFAFQARYPNAALPANIDQLTAEEGEVESISAMAVRGYQTMSGPLQWVRAIDNFFEAGEIVQIGDFVEVSIATGILLRKNSRAVFATQDEVNAAQLAADSKPVGKK